MAHSSREKKAREGESRGGKKAHSKRASRGGVKSAKVRPLLPRERGTVPASRQPETGI